MIAIFHAAAAVVGAAMLPSNPSPATWVERGGFLVYLCFLLLSGFAAYLLLHRKPRARALSICLLAVQVPQLATPLLSYSLIGPLALTATISSAGDVGVTADVATSLNFQWRKAVDPSILGLNLVAIALLSRWLWAARAASTPPTRGGLVVH